MSVLTIKDLQVYYQTDVYGVKRTVKAVDDISLTLNANEIFGIAGESSCGKTTFIKAISGTIKPPLTVMGGNVHYDFSSESFDILSLSQDELRQARWKRISYVLQGSMSVLNPVRKIWKTFYDFYEAHEQIPDKQLFLQQMRVHVGKLGLPSDVLNEFPHHLSGGMRQRVAIALATVFKPNVIIADEPTTALDVIVQRGVLQMLKDIQAEQQNTVIFVSHDMAVHANIADRIGIMYAGRIVEDASVEDAFERPIHPYTKHLIRSLPMIGDKSYRDSIPGAPPNLANPPDGCRFHPRCPYAMTVCTQEVPPLLQVKNRPEGHRVACFLTEEEGQI